MAEWETALDDLRRVLGDELAARLTGFAPPAAGALISPSTSGVSQIVMARQLIRLLLSDEEAPVVRAWLVSPHGELDGRAPADVFVERPDSVMWAAARIVENACEGCIG